MKKNIITFLASLAILVSCDYNDKFEGLEKADQPTNVAKYETEYTKTFEAGKSMDEIRTTISKWLMSQYFTADSGSYASVTFHQEVATPSYIAAIDSADIYVLTLADYQKAWGEGSDRNFFTPQKPASNFIPAILADVYSGVENGKIIFINYNQANTEPEENFSEIYSVNALYQYTGSKWEIYSTQVRMLVLGKTDFEEMNIGNDYFDSSAKADYYLPVYLGLHYPYAQEGAQTAVAYKQFEDDKMMVRADLYVFTGKWEKADTITTFTEKYIFTGNKEGWKFDTTLDKTLKK